VIDRGNTGCGIWRAAPLATGLGTLMPPTPLARATGVPDVATTRCGSTTRGAGLETGFAAGDGAGGLCFELKSDAKIPTFFD